MGSMRNRAVQNYKAVFISDLHLGSPDCKHDILNKFLESFSTEYLFLVGDIIDIEYLNRKSRAWRKTHTDIIRKILKINSGNTKVVYIKGNHDESLFQFGDLEIEGIEIAQRYEYRSKNGKLLLIEHGDQFELREEEVYWRKKIGSASYKLLLAIDNLAASISSKSGLKYFSLATPIKSIIPQVKRYVTKFESNAIATCKSKGFDGIICGHIHFPNKIVSDYFSYFNCGDWVENCSALVEHHDGTMHLISDKTREKSEAFVPFPT